MIEFMAHLIDKDALVAEIDKRISQLESKYKELSNFEVWITAKEIKYKIDGLKEALSFVNTIEVKEVDIKDSIKETLAQKYIDYTFRRHNIDPESKEGQLIYYAYMHGMNQCLTQLRTQKGEYYDRQSTENQGLD